ncbi:MAG: hypothetical protein RL660_790 [Bacteroidota bacterium]|jgi:hypothetical protein
MPKIQFSAAIRLALLSTLKTTSLCLLLLCTSQVAQAVEGMWLPFLLQSLNEKEMRSMGMQITAKDIYNESKSSLKDAVLLFGSGCTGEVISNQGLVLTNHHCGYGTVSGLSSLQNDYLQNGFWAKNNAEELACPGLSVTFIVKIVDVTDRVTAGLSDDLRDTSRTNEVARRQQQLIKENTKDGYGAFVRGFYADNKYFMFITEKFTDVRLVGFPPNGIGKFGGDTDNWAWPRHTGDFSLFRIYAGKDNRAAAYSKDNKPYVPKKYFKINISGVKPGDFTMVYGFPGRTQQNLTSAGVSELMNVSDPARIHIREELLKIMDADMRSDRATFLQYASKQAGIANYYKKWQGELRGLKINNAIAKKETAEVEFTNWVNADATRKDKYGTVLREIRARYDAQRQAIEKNIYFDEAWDNCDLLSQAEVFAEMITILERTKNMDSIAKFKQQWKDLYASINPATEKKIALKMVSLMKARFGSLPLSVYNNAEELYNTSLVTDEARMLAIFDEQDLDLVIKKLKNDPGYKAAQEVADVRVDNFEEFRANQFELIALYHTYVQAKFAMANGKAIYPDANSTLRVSYGKVEGLTPQDGMQYSHYTTLDGQIAKHDTSIEEFIVPEKLFTLWRNKDYGRYAMPNGQMPLAFLASNHTTGGNSGSPVLNARGELIGTNFDRIYEGTMSDVMYDINLCRNITLDIRYTLFIIEKFGDAGWLLNEMTIVDTPVAKTAMKATKKPTKPAQRRA